jgi:hypothetical protein
LTRAITHFELSRKRSDRGVITECPGDYCAPGVDENLEQLAQRKRVCECSLVATIKIRTDIEKKPGEHRAWFIRDFLVSLHECEYRLDVYTGDLTPKDICKIMTVLRANVGLRRKESGSISELECLIARSA